MEKPLPPEIEEAARRTAENIKKYKETGEESEPIDVAEIKREMEESIDITDQLEESPDEVEDITDELDELLVEEKPIFEVSDDPNKLVENVDDKMGLDLSDLEKEPVGAGEQEPTEEEKTAAALQEHEDYVKQLDQEIEESARQGKREEAEAARQMEREQAEAAQQELAERKAATERMKAEMEQAEKDQAAMQEIADKQENRAESGSTVELAEQPQAAAEQAAETAPAQRDYAGEWNQQQQGLEQQRLQDLEQAVDQSRNDLATKFGVTDANSYAQQLLVSGWARAKHALKMMRPSFRKTWKRFTATDRELDSLKKSDVLPDVKAMPKSRQKGGSDQGGGSVFSVKQK
jgi:tRNA splicing endonuclease